DGHTASLFPGAEALSEKERLAVATRAPGAGPRVTLTLPVINAARAVVFVVGGAEKARTIADVLHGECRPTWLPSQGVKPTRGTLLWLLDREAAALLRAQGHVDP